MKGDEKFCGNESLRTPQPSPCACISRPSPNRPKSSAAGFPRGSPLGHGRLPHKRVSLRRFTFQCGSMIGEPIGSPAIDDLDLLTEFAEISGRIDEDQTINNESCAVWPAATQDKLAPVGPLRISIPVQSEMQLLSTRAQLNKVIALLCAILALKCLAMLVMFVSFLNERRTTRAT
jgi:hypothetical protein